MFDVEAIRTRFPALTQANPAIYFDGPGGTQVPKAVIDSMSNFMSQGVANLGGFYPSSRAAQQQVERTRAAVASFIHANHPSEISFGQNMTSITMALSHAIAQTWQTGDHIIVSELDHEANISPWLRQAKERNVNAHLLPFDPQAYTLQLDQLEAILKQEKTKLIAITLASNICGSVTDIQTVSTLAQQYGVKLFIDAVHFIAHYPVDVQAIQCDWLVCSGYKFCGPHIGILYSNPQAMAEIEPYKIAPAPSQLPCALETGTQNFEALAGLEAALYHQASLTGEDISQVGLAHALTTSKAAIVQHERELKRYFLAQLQHYPNITVHGIQSLDYLNQRTPTFALSVKGIQNKTLARALTKAHICVGYGHFYVPRFIHKLGLDPEDGILRIGFAYYNTKAEIDAFFDVFTDVLEPKSHR